MSHWIESLSIIFLFAENLKYFEEEWDDVDVDDGSSENVVIELEFVVFSSEDLLSIDEKVDTVDHSENAGNSCRDKTAS